MTKNIKGSNQQRIQSLDLYRGIALACVIMLHASIYNFGKIGEVDLNTAPLIVSVIGVLGLWGGIFIIHSLVVHTLMLLRRSENGLKTRHLSIILITGFAYLVLHYILSIFLGRWEIEPGAATSSMTVAAEFVRNHHLQFPDVVALLDGSILSTISMNLLIVGPLVYLLFRKKHSHTERNAYIVLGGLAVAFLIAAQLRYKLFPIWTDAYWAKDYLTATITGWFIGFPYPPLSYLSFSLIGAIIGVLTYYKRTNMLKRVFIPVGLLLIIVGIAASLTQPITFNKPDLFWQFKSIAELGIFVLLFVFVLTYVNHKPLTSPLARLFLWFSRISLTIYMLETVASEMLRYAWFTIYPSWDQSVWFTILFGVSNIVWWMLVCYLWSKYDFRYSLEYFWIKQMKKLGKKSTKLDSLPQN